MTILVPIDERATSEAALRAAEQIARADDARNRRMTVGKLPETAAHEENARTQLNDRLERASARLSDVLVDTRVQLAGDPVRGESHPRAEKLPAQTKTVCRVPVSSSAPSTRICRGTPSRVI